jgi:hypothetical protein
MTRLLHSRTMTFPFELHPNTSGTGGAVAKDCPDQKHAVAFALPFIPLLDSARRPRALALMRELRPEAADPAVQFCSLPRDQESRRISGFQRPAIKTSRNTALENDSCLVPGCGPCHRHRFVPPLSLSLRGAPCRRSRTILVGTRCGARNTELRRRSGRGRVAAVQGMHGTSRRVQLKGTTPAVTSAHEATTFWSTTGEMGPA